jgi:hypothetical protein
MLRNRLYYSVKPLVPLPICFAIRRWFAVRKRRLVDGAWPILPGSEVPPDGWPGWPEGKRFDLVLTHDVEGPSGLPQTRPPGLGGQPNQQSALYRLGMVK